jgi:hypothetical protein
MASAPASAASAAWAASRMPQILMRVALTGMVAEGGQADERRIILNAREVQPVGHEGRRGEARSFAAQRARPIHRRLLAAPT